MLKAVFLLSLFSVLALSKPYTCEFQRVLGCCGNDLIGSIELDSSKLTQGEFNFELAGMNLQARCQAGEPLRSGENRIACALFRRLERDILNQVTSVTGTDGGSLIESIWIPGYTGESDAKEAIVITCSNTR